MSDNSDKAVQFSVGDKIVRLGKVYEIFQIKEKMLNDQDEKQELICFRPVYTNNATRSLVCSIPKNNIGKTRIRKPLAKSRFSQLFSSVKIKKNKKKLPTNKVKDAINSYNLEKIYHYLIKLWLEKHDEDINFTDTKKRLFKSCLNMLYEEYALVHDIELEQARDKIIDQLRHVDYSETTAKSK